MRSGAVHRLPGRLTAPDPGWTTSADVVVIGSGIAGLTAALRLRDKVEKILVVTKDVLAAGSTQWAQGGIAAALGPGDTPAQHEVDTLVAGAGACDLQAVRVLVEAGADINARSTVLEAPVLEFPRSGGPNSPLPRGGWTALMFAARDGAIDAARTLADLGANLNLTALPQTDVPLKPEEIAAAQAKNIGTSALVFAIINVHYDLAAMLLDKGADPNVVDGAGMGALYAAVEVGQDISPEYYQAVAELLAYVYRLEQQQAA